MHNFTIYIELNDKGKMSNSTYLRLKEYCNILSNISLTMVWMFPSNVKSNSLYRIIKFERKFCTYKQLIVHNVLIGKIINTSLMSKYLINKYNFKISDNRSESFEKDCARICFGNQPQSCMFNSCLGKSVYITIDGTPRMCPFVPNDIFLATSSEMQNIYEIFNTEGFVNLISSSIKRRNICKSSCEYFSSCKGYCPLDSVSDLPEKCTVRETIMAKQKAFHNQSMANEPFREQVIEQIAGKYKL